MGAKTTIVRIVPTTACHVKIGANPTAAADGTSMYLPAGVVEYFGVKPGQKIAIIQDSAVGNAFITEGA